MSKYKFHYINGDKFPTVIIGADKRRFLRDFFEDQDYFYYNPQDRKIFVNFQIIVWMTYYIFRTRSLGSAYLTAIIRTKADSICITLIDNSIHFFRAARCLYKNLRFIAIQNGNRFDLRMWPKKKQNEIFLPEYACFGQQEIDLLTELGVEGTKFHMIGSLMAKSFTESIVVDQKDNEADDYSKYDICIISECFAGYNSKYPGIEDAVGNIMAFSQRFAKENNMNMVVAMKYPFDSEIANSGLTETEFIKKYIDIDSVTLAYRNNNEWGSYSVSLKSKVSLGMVSTLLLETASLGNKVMICDFYGKPWTIAVKEPLAHINFEQSYTAFAQALTSLLNESDALYWQKREELINYYIKNGDTPTVTSALSKIIAN